MSVHIISRVEKMKNCETCGTTLSDHLRADAKYCSATCRSEAAVLRKHGRHEPHNAIEADQQIPDSLPDSAGIHHGIKERDISEINQPSDDQIAIQLSRIADALERLVEQKRPKKNSRLAELLSDKHRDRADEIIDIVRRNNSDKAIVKALKAAGIVAKSSYYGDIKFFIPLRNHIHGKPGSNASFEYSS